jgi:hypothetical protein
MYLDSRRVSTFSLDLYDHYINVSCFVHSGRSCLGVEFLARGKKGKGVMIELFDYS